MVVLLTKLIRKNQDYKKKMLEEERSTGVYKNEGDIQNCANYGAIKLGEISRAMLVIRTKCFGGTNFGGAV